ncbi:probable rRNA maturation factor [Melghirimyces thermohalophilus]|uniref:Endoribonuclease YbeY n=1 Tax=Melghirimyces thermohalophilus TaxID=1236220 RepID=A0A1G6P3J5_9BACL|nr:probable rRNA maturation factor [Melghirimyces thermohalophilus]
MNLNVELEVRSHLEQLPSALLTLMEQCLAEAAEMEELPDSEVSVTIVDDGEIHRLNKEYRQVDRPTDVLSFPQWDPEEEWNLDAAVPIPLGDIVISFPRAQEQAQAYNHSLERELGFLAVHGFLHLLGYDHGNKQAEREMFSRQEEILSRAGLKR